MATAPTADDDDSMLDEMLEEIWEDIPAKTIEYSKLDCLKTNF